MKRARILQVAAIAATVGLALAGCSGSGESAGEGEQTLRLAVNAPPSNFTVGSWGGGDAVLMSSVYDSLFISLPDGTIEPSIAESYEYSDDRTELTLHLREGMNFTNDEVVDADAVVASLEQSRQGPSTSGNLVNIEKVTASDDETVVIDLAKPDAALLGQLAGAPGMVGAPSVLSAESSKLDPIGSGAYVLDKKATTVGSKYVLTKNEDHWNADSYPYETVEVSVIADSTAVQNALQAGQLDYGGVTSGDVVKQFDSAKFNSGNTKSTALAAIWIADYAGDIVPALADVRVRQAINMAFDREKMAASINPGTNTPNNQLYSPAGEAFDPELLSVYEQDIEEAKALLAEAGYPDGFDVTMPSTVVSTPYESVITQSLGDIGVRVTWETVPFQDLFTKIFGGSYGMFFMYTGFNLNDAVDTINNLEGGFNPFGYMPDELQALIDAANAAPEADQPAAYRTINEWLVENAWSVPLLNTNGFYVVSSSIDFTSPKVYGINLLPFQIAE